MQIPRREFLSRAVACAIGTLASPRYTWPSLSPQLLYPPIDLSVFDRPISRAPAEIRIGCAANTRQVKDREVMAEIAALGFRGIQLRENSLQEFRSSTELREILLEHCLKMVALSTGNLTVEPALRGQEIRKHLAHAKVLYEVGGLYLGISDQRPQNRSIAAADYKRLGACLTEIGKRTADLGVSLGYSNHVGSLGERPEDVDRVLEASDPRYVKLQLDVPHYIQGGGDPALAIRNYGDRLLFLHVKYVGEGPGATGYRSASGLLELGGEKVDVTAVFASLRQICFRGWAIVELDDVSAGTRTRSRDWGASSQNYIEPKLGQSL